MNRVILLLALIVAVAMPSQAFRGLSPIKRGWNFGGVPIVRGEKLF